MKLFTVQFYQRELNATSPASRSLYALFLTEEDAFAAAKVLQARNDFNVANKQHEPLVFFVRSEFIQG